MTLEKPRMNRFTLYAFLAGLLIAGLSVYFLMPTKIVTKDVLKTVEVEKVVNHDIITHQIKTVYKDGTITTVTDSHDLSKDSVQTKEVIKESTKSTRGLNMKRVLVLGGIDPLDRNKWIVGASYNVLGPFDAGFIYQRGPFVTLGLRF